MARSRHAPWLVAPAGFEPASRLSVEVCPIQLNDGALSNKNLARLLELPRSVPPFLRAQYVENVQKNCLDTFSGGGRKAKTRLLRRVRRERLLNFRGGPDGTCTRSLRDL